MKPCIGKKCLVFSIAFIAFTLAFSGCNFFKKEDSTVTSMPPGQLPNGLSIVGTWTADYADSNAGDNPDIAQNVTYVFDPAGNATIIVQDMHNGGALCSGFGPYRLTNTNNFVIFIQAANPPTCGFAPQINLLNVQVQAKSLQYVDGTSSQPVALFANNAQNPVVVGLWDFQHAGADSTGSGGIDYLLFDPYGYFVLQTTSNSTQYLLEGFYTIATGVLSLSFFDNMDPTQVSGSPTTFSPFSTDGNVLQLGNGTDSSGNPITYAGNRL